MDKPRIFLGSSGKQQKLLQALTRGLEDIANVARGIILTHPLERNPHHREGSVLSSAHFHLLRILRI